MSATRDPRDGPRSRAAIPADWERARPAHSSRVGAGGGRDLARLRCQGGPWCLGFWAHPAVRAVSCPAKPQVKGTENGYPYFRGAEFQTLGATLAAKPREARKPGPSLGSVGPSGPVADGRAERRRELVGEVRRHARRGRRPRWPMCPLLHGESISQCQTGHIGRPKRPVLHGEPKPQCQTGRMRPRKRPLLHGGFRPLSGRRCLPGREAAASHRLPAGFWLEPKKLCKQLGHWRVDRWPAAQP